MKAGSQIQVKAPVAPSFSSVPAGLFGSACACGGSSGVTGTCEGCSNKKLSMQRQAALRLKARRCLRLCERSWTRPAKTRRRQPRLLRAPVRT